tara:strand:- start:1292 stop:2059 length:768 start_codon:yes stop_codon:yes gene_type:complete
MARYASLNRRLDYHLYPQGRSASEPSLIPNVKDSDGNIVQYYSGDRITSESTVVDIGSSPNANDGDPLRTAFIKINNFVEAEYITNEIIDQELNRLEFNGPFLGILDYVDLPLTMISDKNVAVVKTTLSAAGYSSWNTTYPNISSSSISLSEGNVVLHKGSLIQYNKTTNIYDVLYQNSGDFTAYDFGTSLSRFKEGTADADLTSAQQLELYNRFNETEAGSNINNNVKSRNVNDAITETHLRFSNRGFDSGYYG